MVSSGTKASLTSDIAPSPAEKACHKTVSFLVQPELTSKMKKDAQSRTIYTPHVSEYITTGVVQGVCDILCLLVGGPMDPPV
jgi:hypothetical protein